MTEDIKVEDIHARQIRIEETPVLIAKRQPPGDRWKLISDGVDGKVYKSLTDVLEAYMTQTKFRGDYRLSPMTSELFAITTSEHEVKPQPVKQYSLYGEY